MYSHSLKMRKSFEALQLSFIKNPYTELGTLFMNPNARGIGGGKLLSFARFLYMSNNLNRFDKEVVVEVGGTGLAARELDGVVRDAALRLDPVPVDEAD